VWREESERWVRRDMHPAPYELISNERRVDEPRRRRLHESCKAHCFSHPVFLFLVKIQTGFAILALPESLYAILLNGR
jgi:hypothetical protein